MRVIVQLGGLIGLIASLIAIYSFLTGCQSILEARSSCNNPPSIGEALDSGSVDQPLGTDNNEFIPTPIPQDTPKILPTVTPPITYTIEFTVSSTTDRNYTDINVNHGETISIDYVRGQWRAGPLPTWPLHGPEGDPQTPNKQTFPIRDAPIMSLVVGIDNNVIDTVGSHWTFVNDVNGTLWLGANDDDFSDNVGSLIVRIMVGA